MLFDCFGTVTFVLKRSLGLCQSLCEACGTLSTNAENSGSTRSQIFLSLTFHCGVIHMFEPCVSRASKTRRSEDEPSREAEDQSQPLPADIVRQVSDTTRFYVPPVSECRPPPTVTDIDNSATSSQHKLYIPEVFSSR